MMNGKSQVTQIILMHPNMTQMAKATTFGYVEIKVKGDSSYANQTYKVPFEIQPLLVTGDTITVPKTISYNKGYSSTDASDYKASCSC